ANSHQGIRRQAADLAHRVDFPGGLDLHGAGSEAHVQFSLASSCRVSARRRRSSMAGVDGSARKCTRISPRSSNRFINRYMRRFTRLVSSPRTTEKEGLVGPTTTSTGPLMVPLSGGEAGVRVRA